MVVELTAIAIVILGAVYPTMYAFLFTAISPDSISNDVGEAEEYIDNDMIEGMQGRSVGMMMAMAGSGE